MSFCKKHWKYLLIALCEAVIGVLLLFHPAVLTTLVLLGAGIALLLLGVARIVRYFKAPPAAAARDGSLMRGMLLVALGALCLFKHQWLIGILLAPVVLYGAGLLLCGAYKLQTAMDMKRLKVPGVLWQVLDAVLTVVFGVVIILNPFATVNALWIFAGIMLLVSAALDLLAVWHRRAEGEVV